MNALRRLVVIVAMAFWLAWTMAAQPAAESVRLPCIADANLSSYETETRLNYGASTRIRLKGIQMLGVFKFDTGPIAGKVIESARVHLRYAGNDRKLRTLGFSTIAVPWDEGTGAGTEQQGQLCFISPELGRRHWTTPDSDFTDASFLPEASLVSYSDIRNDADDWISAEIAPRIVQAMAVGLSHGIVVTDEKGQTMANNDIFSREQADSAPYLTVRVRPASPAERAAPKPLTVTLRPEPRTSDVRGSALRAAIAVGPECLGVQARLRIEGEKSDRPVPMATLGAMPRRTATVLLDGLPGDKRVSLIVTGVGLTGAVGPATVAQATTPKPPERPSPLVPLQEWHRLGPAPVRTSGPASVLLHAGLIRLAASRNQGTADIAPIRGTGHLWDGRRIVLSACRGERIALTVGIRLETESAEPLPVAARTEGLPARMAVCRVLPPVAQPDMPDICVPIASALKTGNPSGRATPELRQYLLELDIPASAAVGPHRGMLALTLGSHKPAVWPITVDVLPAVLPARLSFHLSLNTYGSPARSSGADPASQRGLEIERAYHRLAHEHRGTLTPLGYSHSGTVEPDYAPELAGEGSDLRVRDWSAWDRRFGAYLDGSAFAGLPRGGQPIGHLYLPFHEAWPVDIRTHYAYKPSTQAYPAVIAEHALLAGPIEALMSKEYGAGFEAVLRDFTRHIHDRGWRRTAFHFYLNNKHYYRDPAQGGRGTSWWLLDEPMHRDDWLALAYFARMLKAAGDHSSIVFRADISRPQWQRDYLDGLVDLMVVNDELFARPTLMRRLRQRLGVTLWHYGEAPDPAKPLTDFVSWPIRAWLAGADGIVPWQSVGSADSVERASATALIVPGSRFGSPEPLATIRLKALAEGVQCVELIAALASQRRWTRDQCAAALAPYLHSRDWQALCATLHHALRQPSLANHSAQRRGHTETGPARRARPKP